MLQDMHGIFGGRIKGGDLDGDFGIGCFGGHDALVDGGRNGLVEKSGVVMKLGGDQVSRETGQD